MEPGPGDAADETLERGRAEGALPRDTATRMARARVCEAMRYRCK